MVKFYAHKIQLNALNGYIYFLKWVIAQTHVVPHAKKTLEILH